MTDSSPAVVVVGKALGPEYDANNDRFVLTLCCPWPTCGAPLPAHTLSGPAPGQAEQHLCPRCLQPFDLVTLPEEADIGGQSPVLTRRPFAQFCPRTGMRLRGVSPTDWAGAGGGNSGRGAQDDAALSILGVPHRDIEWDLQQEWSQERWGSEEEPRNDEQVTSVSVVSGVVVMMAASGRMGLFDSRSGAPLLRRSIEWPRAGIDDAQREHAVRLPPAFQGTAMVAQTDQVALFRDLAGSFFPGAASTSSGAFSSAAPSAGCQWIGSALLCGEQDVRAVLVEGAPVGLNAAPAQAALRFFTTSGEEITRVSAPELVRAPVYDDTADVLLWVTRLGHVHQVPRHASEQVSPEQYLPETMLRLAPTERAQLAISPANDGSDELWLADDAGGTLRVWRASLQKIRDPHALWTWELMFEGDDLGALRGFCVGKGSPQRGDLAGQLFVLASPRSVSAYSRAVRASASDAVLVKEPIAPPVLTQAGFFVQDRQGLWLRGLPPWSWRDDNVQRVLLATEPDPHAGFYDRTLAVFGRQVFYAFGSRVHAGRLLARKRAPQHIPQHIPQQGSRGQSE